MRIILCILFALANVLSVSGQDWDKTSAPKILSISTEVLKLGKEAAHGKIESGWRRAFTKVKWTTHFLGLASLTGPPTMLFLTGYDSLAAWQKEDETQSANAWLWAEQDKLHFRTRSLSPKWTTNILNLIPSSQHKRDSRLDQPDAFPSRALKSNLPVWRISEIG